MIFPESNGTKRDFSRKRLNFTPKTIVFVISIEWCCLKVNLWILYLDVWIVYLYLRIVLENEGLVELHDLLRYVCSVLGEHKQDPNKQTSPATNKSINQSINPSINQSINQPINQYINPSMNQTVSQLINKASH